MEATPQTIDVWAAALEAAPQLEGIPTPLLWYEALTWRGLIDNARDIAEHGRHLEEGGYRYYEQRAAVLGIILLSYLGQRPPLALEHAIDMRLAAMDASRVHPKDEGDWTPPEGHERFRSVIRVIRHLLKVYGPKPSEGTP